MLVAAMVAVQESHLSHLSHREALSPPRRPV